MSIGMMYITILPAIMAAILNMVWCKTHFLKKLQIPIDNGKNFVDGKRVFGKNKTWKGLIGYVILNTIMGVIWGWICNAANLNQYNFFYINNSNTFLYSLLIGFLFGLGYSLFELPNSFLKRRLNIVEGQSASGAKKVFFTILDQADSAFGCCLVICLFYQMSILFYFQYVLLATITHFVFNILLYFLKLRKNMF